VVCVGGGGGESRADPASSDHFNACPTLTSHPHSMRFLHLTHQALSSKTALASRVLTLSRWGLAFFKSDRCKRRKSEFAFAHAFDHHTGLGRPRMHGSADVPALTCSASRTRP
jgi:hypothetical protein